MSKKKIVRFADIPQFTRSGSYAVDLGVEYLCKWVSEETRENGLQMNPVFQRGHVWTEKQQIAFLEYFFRGGRSGTTVYFNKPDWLYSVPQGAYNDFVCVDGLQRITAIQRFVNNEIPVFGTYYREFLDKPRTLFTIQVVVNDLHSPQEVLQWYIDMNSAGTQHSKAEIERVQKMLKSLK